MMNFGDVEPSTGTQVLNMGTAVYRYCDDQSSCSVPIWSLFAFLTPEGLWGRIRRWWNEQTTMRLLDKHDFNETPWSFMRKANAKKCARCCELS
jgi:hypothetical protein